jgi:hypothetical protein
MNNATTTPEAAAVIEQAVYALALLHDLAGVAAEWKDEAIKRGYRKK